MQHDHMSKFRPEMTFRRIFGSASDDSTEWQGYADDNSYDDQNALAKSEFVENACRSISPRVVWDLGSNSGEYSKIAARYSDSVVAIDGDPGAIERLYCSMKNQQSARIQPLIMDLANPSPNHGWAGRERKSLQARSKPDLVLCLALLHHIRLSNHVPFDDFFEWLHDLNSHVVLEFVDRRDDMVQTLLSRKSEKYPDYQRSQFDRALEKRFTIIASQDLKAGHRTLLLLVPKK